MKKFIILLTALIAAGATVYADYNYSQKNASVSAYIQTENDENGDCRMPRVILKRKNGIAV